MAPYEERSSWLRELEGKRREVVLQILVFKGHGIAVFKYQTDLGSNPSSAVY